MEFEVDHEEADEEMEISAGAAAAAAAASGPPGWESSSAGAGGATTSSAAGRSSGPPTPKGGGFRYRECQKNHAVGIGGHAVDGCCEFMAAGDEGSLDALKCAACNCHRNFHRREPLSASAAGGTTAAAARQAQAQAPFHAHPPPLPPHHHFPSAAAAYYRSPAPPPSGPSGYLHVRPLALPGTDAGEDLVSNPSSSGGGGGGGRGGGGGGSSSSKKRFRTKFSQDQKERMLEFAERVGWRIQKHDEAAVEQFCSETGVRRQVLKVWMHNNKHTLGKKP